MSNKDFRYKIRKGAGVRVIGVNVNMFVYLQNIFVHCSTGFVRSPSFSYFIRCVMSSGSLNHKRRKCGPSEDDTCFPFLCCVKRVILATNINSRGLENVVCRIRSVDKTTYNWRLEKEIIDNFWENRFSFHSMLPTLILRQPVLFGPWFHFIIFCLLRMFLTENSLKCSVCFFSFQRVLLCSPAQKVQKYVSRKFS